MVSVSAQAAIVDYQGAQGPKPDLFDPAPPTLLPVITSAQANFAANVTKLGDNQFEAGSLNFGYGNGGQATFSGGAVIKDGAFANPTFGRYNMTPDLLAGNPPVVQPGHWLEASSSFTINFSAAISAFSFFATDIGDFKGLFTLELYNGNTLLRSLALANDEEGPDPNAGVGNMNMTTGNGNLLYVGITSTNPLETFTRAEFKIVQCTFDPANPDLCPVGTVDVIGLDSLILGNYNGTPPGTVPEPASLALVGLALAGLGASRARRRA
jgi:hypothetical protein